MDSLHKKAVAAVEILKKLYPDALCSLHSASALELLIATRLSAQCTDERVNKVTGPLFARFRTAQSFAEAPVEEIESYVHSCGLYKTKARDIVAMCRVLVEQYGGTVPDTIEELVKLPGVGRKTANLVVGDIFGKPSYVVDTHCIRLCGRIGLVTSKDPLKIERALRELIPPEESGDFCHRLVLHGRAVCKARGPQCGDCALSGLCAFARAAAERAEM